VVFAAVEGRWRGFVSVSFTGKVFLGVRWEERMEKKEGVMLDAALLRTAAVRQKEDRRRI
jgi:hypothetical protein